MERAKRRKTSISRAPLWRAYDEDPQLRTHIDSVIEEIFKTLIILASENPDAEFLTLDEFYYATRRIGVKIQKTELERALKCSIYGSKHPDILKEYNLELKRTIEGKNVIDKWAHRGVYRVVEDKVTKEVIKELFLSSRLRLHEGGIV